MTRAPVLDGQETPRRRRSRLRRLVARSALVVVVLVALRVALLGWTYVSAETHTAGKVAFERPLAIPPLAPSRVDDQGRRVFDLELQQGSTDIGQGRPTPTWGVNGDYLGPTLRARRGEEVLVNVTNRVGEETTLHWHGMHLPARMDGGPHQIIAPGETWSPTWQVDQPAATLWYHPHLHGATADHVLRGLAGMFLLDDAQSRRLDLPHEYGVDDVREVVQDRSFDDDGEMEEGARFLNTTGFVGDTVGVNGTVGPYVDGQTELVRLRVLNASNARIYNFGFDYDRTFAMVASDGGLLEAPHQTDRLLLPPGGCASRRRARAASSTCQSSTPRRRPPPASSACPAPRSTAPTRTWNGSTRRLRSARPRSGGSRTTTASRTASTSTTCSSR